nr:coat protein [Chrysanthemum virus D]
MSTVVVSNQPKKNGRRTRARRARRSQPVRTVVMATANRQPRRRNRRRRNRNARRRRSMGNAGGPGKVETFQFNKDGLKGNSYGTITFGPDLSESVALSGGILRAYKQYKITSLTIQFKRESSATAEGSIAYELDPYCKNTELKSTLRKFSITRNEEVRFPASQINGTEWHDVADNQFKLHYKGNGTTATAGYFHIIYTVVTQGPK